jgi:lipoprotein-releasing system permease protein
MNRWLLFEWIVALRFLREGRTQTLFIIAGVAIGVSVIVFMSALLSGLQSNLIRRVLSAQAHVQLLPPREVARALGPPPGARAGTVEDAIIQAPLQRLKSIDQWQAIATQIRAMPDVAVVSPVASGSVLVVRGAASRAASVTGMDPDVYYRIVDLPGKIVRGTARVGSTDVIIGTELGSDLGLGVGDKLRMSSAAGGEATLTVVGIVDLGSKPANQRAAYTALRTAQSLLGLIGGVSSIDVTVNDVYAAEVIARHITALTGVQADSWIATNAQFFTAVQAQTTSNTTIRLFVALSVAFGIASVLVVSVVQKSREIGILRAMGVTRGQVLRVFLLQGGLLGLAGSAVGASIGMLGVLVWQSYVLNPDGTPLFPIVIEPSLLLAALLLATLTGLAAAFAPALRAARLDPVVAIRG